MQTIARFALALAIPLLVTTGAAAQEPRFHAAVKGGVTNEHSEDGLTGTVPALGLTAGVAFSPNWRGEAEFWLPGYLEDARGEPKHRDVLYSFSAVRLFGSGQVRPFVVAGLTFARVQDWFTFCTANRGGGPALVSCDEPDVVDVRREKNVGTDGYLLAGGGVEIPLGDRLRVVADLRLSLAPASILVRPGLGLSVTF
jgi:hypothetical protein